MIPRVPNELRASGRHAVLATLVGGAGGSRIEGATMWVDERSGVVGGVTIGGCVEGRIVAEADAVLRGADTRLVRLALGDDDALELGLGCAGEVEVLLEPVSLTDALDPVLTALGAVDELAREGCVLAQIAALEGPPRRLVVGDDGRVAGSLGTRALDDAAAIEGARALADGRARVIALGDDGPRAWIAPHAPPRTLLVFGASPVAPPLVRFASSLGWHVTVIDSRERFLTRERFPDADQLHTGLPSEIAESLARGARCAVVVLAHDYKIEVPVLRAVLAADAGYVGVVGSRKRGAALLAFLRDAGVREDELRRVRVPIGLDLGARTSEEIALSIVAEILAAATGRNGAPLSSGTRGAA